MWGPIWGFVAFEKDCNTVFGASFDHKTETPGLGAEIRESFFEDEFIGIGQVIAVEFNHSKENFYAFYFKNNKNFGDYFDEKGGTLRKAFLRAPLNFSRISSRYSKRRS